MHLARTGQEKEANFRIDWHLVALPIIQERSQKDPLFIFKRWLARMLILRPIPSLIIGDSNKRRWSRILRSRILARGFQACWLTRRAAYAKIDEYLKQVMPDLKDIKNPVIGKDSRSLVRPILQRPGKPEPSFRGSV